MLYSIARAAGVHFNHCVSPPVRPWSDSVNALNSRTTQFILIKFCIQILLDFSLSVKAAPHECVIRTGQL